MSTEIAIRPDEPETDVVKWELAAQWRLAWRALKWSFTALSVLGFLVVIGQGFLFYRMFADIHPALGLVFVILLAAILIILVGRPLASFFSTPVMARPPSVHLDADDPSKAAMSARLTKSPAPFIETCRFSTSRKSLTSERPALRAALIMMLRFALPCMCPAP